MLVKADGKQRAMWCLRDPQTGVMMLACMVESEAAAHRLRSAHLIHKRHEGLLEIVAVLMTVDEARPAVSALIEDEVAA